MDSQLVLPEAEGYKLMREDSETKTIREWKKIHPDWGFEENSDEKIVIYRLVNTGTVLKNLELACVEPVIVFAGFDFQKRGGDYTELTRKMNLKRVIDQVNNRFPFFAISDQQIVQPIDHDYKGFTYLLNLYREK